MDALWVTIRPNKEDGHPWIPAFDTSLVTLASLLGAEHIAEATSMWTGMVLMDIRKYHDETLASENLAMPVWKRVHREDRLRHDSYLDALNPRNLSIANSLNYTVSRVHNLSMTYWSLATTLSTYR